MRLIIVIFVLASIGLATDVGGGTIPPSQFINNSASKNSDMQKEIWKDLAGHEGYYQISNYGNVKSLSRVVNCKGGTKRNPERILKRKYDKDGYVLYCLSKLNVKTYIKAHREVLNTFSDNPNNYSQVNHKNGVKDDNFIYNLEWCTPSQNNTHKYRVLNQEPSKGMLGRKGVNNPCSKKVIQYDVGGKKVNEFNSIIEAANSVGSRDGSGVSQVCRNIKNKFKGFIWKYKTEQV